MPYTRIFVEFLDSYAKSIDASTANQLPSKKEVLLAVYYDKIRKNITYEESVKLVANDILDVWKKASIPTVSAERVIHVMKEYIEKFLKLMNADKNRVPSANFLAKKNTFIVSYLAQLIFFIIFHEH